MLKKIILWLLVILTCVMIFNFSSKVANKSNKQSEVVVEKVEDIVTEITDKELSNTEKEQLHNFTRKQGHFIEFLLLGFFSLLLARCYEFSIKKSLLITLLFVLFYACTDEIHQIFIDGRDGNLKDVFIDFLGGVAGTAIVLPIELKKQTKKQ